MGYSVFDTSSIGNDFPDLVLGRAGITALAECKTRAKESHRGRKGDAAHALLSEGQAMFRALWRGSPVLVGYDAGELHQSFEQLRGCR